MDEKMTKTKTNLFLIGAHKAGTTSLYEMLGQHHQIDAPSLKEPGFFSIDGKPNEASLSEYEARYSAQPGEHTYWMDGSTSYAQTIRYPETIDRISAHTGPDLRFIYVVRDPLDRMISAYVQLRSEGLNDLDRDLATALPRLLEPCYYRTHYDRYAERFGAENLLVLTFDHFRSDPASFMSLCFGFLDIPEIDVSGIHANAGVDRAQNGRLLDTVMRIPGARRAAEMVVDSPFERVVSGVRRRLSVPVEKPDITPEMLGGEWAAVSDEAVGILEVARGPKVDWNIGATVS